MNERKMQFRLGVLVVAVMLIVAIMVLLLGTPDTFKQGYPVYVKFENAGGVEIGTPVRNSGILIGRVDAVDLADDGGAIVTLKIDDNRKILPNQTFGVTLTSVLGDVQLNVVRLKGGAETTVGPNEETILIGRSAIDPVHEIGTLQRKLIEAIDVITVTGRNLDNFIKKTDKIIGGNEGGVTTIIDDLSETVKQANLAFKSINSLVGDEQSRENLRKAMNAMPELVTNTSKAVNRLNNTFDSVDRNLRNIEALTKPLGERGPAMVDNVDGALENVKTLTARLATLANTIDDTNGTLGKLIHDDTLYHNLNQASKNIRELTVKLQPIVNDARVITDRMARHPGSIIRDAIKPGSGAKGMPGDFVPAPSSPTMIIEERPTTESYPDMGNSPTSSRQNNSGFRQTDPNSRGRY